MMNTIRVAICVVSLVMTAEPTHAATKVFLLAGQSNMLGVGGPDAPCPSPYNAIQTGVKYWDNGWVNLQLGTGMHAGEFGPEVSFGYTLHNTIFPQDDIYLVKQAKGSTDLETDWNPSGTNNQYTLFTSKVAAAMQNLTAAGKSPAIAGMIWMQGESDAMYTSSSQGYAANLRNFIGEVRDDVHAPNMEFVLGRILPYYDTTAYGLPAGGNALVRAAQETVPGQAGNALWINTDDLTPSTVYGAGHYGTQGQIDLGIRFANQFVPVPEPSSLILAGTSLLALAGYCWRKKSSY